MGRRNANLQEGILRNICQCLKLENLANLIPAVIGIIILCYLSVVSSVLRGFMDMLPGVIARHWLTFLLELPLLCQFVLVWFVGSGPVNAALVPCHRLLEHCAVQSILIVPASRPGPLLVGVALHLTPRLNVHVL